MAKDLRVIKTNKALYDALLELMKNKSFEEIKISDICEKALVNRSTFYAHFEDKYELLVSLFDNQKKILLSKMQNNEHIFNTKEYFIEFLKIIIEHVEENRNVYSSILLNNRNGILIDILLDAINKDINDKLKNNNDLSITNIPNNIISKFYFGGILGIGTEWLRDNKQYSKEQIISYIDKLIPDQIS